MKFQYVLICALLLFLPYANAALEKPNWSVGDYWTYKGSYHVHQPFDYGNYTLDVTIDSNDVEFLIKVEGVEVKNVGGKEMGCYRTSLNATLPGDFSVKGTIINPVTGKEENLDLKGTFDFKITGTIYFTTKNLSVVSNENFAIINLSTNIPLSQILGFSPGGELNVKAEYNPALDFMNFPVEKGEEWEASSYATLYYQEYKTGGEVTFSFKCTNKDGNVYIIKSNYNPFGEVIALNNTYMFWNGDKGMVDQWRISGEGQSLIVQLVDYKYEGKENIPPSAGIDYSPKEPKVGTKILFESKSSDIDGQIISYYWDFGDGKNSTQQSPSHIYTKEGTYTVTLTVMDNYGDEDHEKITIEVKAAGGNTPGFGIILVAMAILLVLLRRKSGNFK